MQTWEIKDFELPLKGEIYWLHIQFDGEHWNIRRVWISCDLANDQSVEITSNLRKDAWEILN